MATTDGVEADSRPRLRQVTAKIVPKSRFPVPESDGYTVYSALLSLLSGIDEEVGASVHDSSLGSLHCSGLQGPFGSSGRSHHKMLLPSETYELSLGIVHPDDESVFQTLVNAVVLEGERIELSHGSLTVERFRSENATHEELLERAGEFDDPTIEMTFETATCIEESGDVTTMFPHRWAVFKSLLGKWEQSSPEDLELDLSKEEIQAHVIEKPDPGRRDGYCLDTHSVLVSRVENEDGKNRNLFSQGFSGECAYEFKGASESVENAVTALALFAEYSGVGSNVARGCGNISLEVS